MYVESSKPINSKSLYIMQYQTENAPPLKVCFGIVDVLCLPLACGLWLLAFGLFFFWHLAFLAFGSLAYGICPLAFGICFFGVIWPLAFGLWPLASGLWPLASGI